MNEPTKPGWWWAKFQDDELWQVVLVDDRMLVFVCGLDEKWHRSDFTFGPEVAKPEGLA